MAQIEYYEKKVKPVYKDGEETGETETVDVFWSIGVPDAEVPAKIAELTAKGFHGVRCPHMLEAAVVNREKRPDYFDPERIRMAD